MDLLLILTYASICIAVFKVFKIPINKWTLPTAILGGIVLIATLLLVMNYNHPFTPLAKEVYVTTPIVPTVKGRVLEVLVTPNQPLRQGDPLFVIEPVTYAAEVSRLQAALEDALSGQEQQDTSVEIAASKTLQAKAQLDRAEREYRRYQQAYEKGAVSQQDFENRRQQYRTTQSAHQGAIGEEKRAIQASQATFQGQSPRVAEIQAQLTAAEFNLEETIVRAPTDGYVTQLALRPGMMAVPLPLRPVMVFVHDEERYFFGAFRQNSVQRLKAGYEAEFLFQGIPGRVFKGEVVEVLPAIGEGEVQAAGTSIGTQFFSRAGRVAVKLRLLDDLQNYHLPQGSAAEIAVYSDHFHHVSILRKILLRMKSWQNYLYLDH
ncbi:MAG: HlyD family secretion protein [Arenicellales bacterium]|jgi:multidrug resistance efflux pump